MNQQPRQPVHNDAWLDTQSEETREKVEGTYANETNFSAQQNRNRTSHSIYHYEDTDD